jgi:hypothetical protein
MQRSKIRCYGNLKLRMTMIHSRLENFIYIYKDINLIYIRQDNIKILKGILTMQNGRMRTRFIWLRTGVSGGLL